MRSQEVLSPTGVLGFLKVIVHAYLHRNDNVPYDLYCDGCARCHSIDELEAMDGMFYTGLGLYIKTICGEDVRESIAAHALIHPGHKVKALRDPHGTMK